MTVYANIALKPATWISLPPRFRPEEPSAEAWAAGYSRDCWKDSGQLFGEEQVENLSATLARLAASLGPGALHPEHELDSSMEIQTALYLPDPGVIPVPVRVMVFHNRVVHLEKLTLRDLVQADDPEAIDEPEVIEFEHPHLGTGLKAFRHRASEPDAGPNTGIFAVLKYAFPIPGHDDIVFVSLSWPDLARVAQARDDIDDLVRSITVEYHEDPGPEAPAVP